MGIFRRKRRQEDVTDAPALGTEASEADTAHGNEPEEDPRETGPEPSDSAAHAGHTASEPGDVAAHADDTALEPGDPAADPEEASGQRPAASFRRDHGPFDADEQAPDADRLDLGSLRLPAAEGLQVQLELDEASASVTAVRLLLEGSYAQLQAFAAPRSGALWPQIRAELADSVRQQGGSAEVREGCLGRELLVERRGTAPLRFLGVDGPRWFLRVVLSGPAATDDAAAAPLLEVVRGTVVVRGSDAMAPRELLPLSVPAVEQVPDIEAEEGAAGERAALDPIQRGPEITEVR